MRWPIVNWTLSELLQPLAVENVPVMVASGISMDSRLVQRGDLYLALAGARTHGIHFAQAAIDAGAVAVLVSTASIEKYAEISDALKSRGVVVIEIAALEERCAEIVMRFYDNPDRKLTVIGVTGTDGKTSVCRFIAAALNSLNKPCGYIGTLGWGISDSLQSTELTTPDVVSLRRMLASLYQQGAQYVVLEASSHGLAEGRLEGLSIDIAVLTNLGRDHLDYHETIDEYRKAKAKLFKWKELKTVVLNGCDSLGRDLAEELEFTDRWVYCSSEDCAKDLPEDVTRLVASNIVTPDTGLEFSLLEAGQKHRISTTLLGHFNVDNLLACYASLRACGIAANDAVHTLRSVPAVPGRMERLGGELQPIIVIDYCHTPQALSIALQAVRVHCKGCLWVVFGCGGDRDAGKRAPMARAAEAADRVVLTDDNPRTEDSSKIIGETLAGFNNPNSVTVIADRASAIKHAVTSAVPADLVLIAGKGHEDYQIIGDSRLPFSDRDQALAALELVS